MSSFKAHEKRKKTLLVEYKNQFKANKFVDKRIGENDTSLSLDEKMFKRFVVERQKRKGGGRKMKTNKYNLNEEDEEEFGGNNKNNVDLTHYGQSIAQMEKFDRGDLSDDNEDDETDLTRGKIGAEIVSDSFFGGFKSNEDSKKSRKDWIEEMIAKSKQAKYERQKERDRTLDMTEELDKEWKNIMPLIGSMNKKLKDEEDAKIANSLDKAPKADEFDVLVKKLQFDPKGKPTDKTKSAEEMRKAEAEETKRQEKELKERMDKEVEVTNEDEKIISKNKKGIKIKKAPANHQSVDDMDFNDPEYLQMWEKEEILKRQKEERKKEEEEAALKRAEELDGEEDEVENEEEEEEEEEGDEEEEDQEEDEDEDEEDEEEDEENEEDGEESEGSLDEEDDEEEEETKEAKKSGKKKPVIEKEPTNNLSRLDELKKLLTSYSNLFKSDSSKPNSKAKIDTEKLNSLTKSIYDLTFNYCSKKSLSAVKNDPATLVALFREMLVEINSVYLQRRLNDRRFPDLEKLFKFKLISSVFPTSDYRHQIVTPCLIIMTRYLTECPIQYVSDLFRGLFLCNLCYDFTLRSKRFIPECIQFLNGVLYLAIDWKSRKISLPNFYSSSICENIKKTKFNLICSKKTDLNDLSLVETSLNESQELDDKLKTSLIGYTLDLITAFVSLNESIVSFKEIFHLTNLLLGYLDKEIYPKEINERVEEVQALISEFGNKEREYLKCLNRKPVVNKLYEPRVEAKSKFDPKHHNSVISERQLLRRKYKKEMKSAIKEIRQDNVFLARVQLKEKMDKDAKRAQKVKEIMGSLANQEGEYQKIKRQKI